MARGRPFGPAQQALLAALRKRAHSLDELVALVEPFGVNRTRLTIMLGNLKNRGYVRHAGRVRSSQRRGWQSMYAIVLVTAAARQQLRQARRVGRVGVPPAAVALMPAWLAPPPAALQSIVPASASPRRVTGVASVAERTALMDDDLPGAIARALARIV